MNQDKVQHLQDYIVGWRRDLHKYAEVAWTEYRTASKVADELERLGFEVFVGDEVILESSMMGVPSDKELEKQRERALSQGAVQKWIEKMTGGKTGVIGVMDFEKPGPTVAVRFDMDANDLDESRDLNHRPFREGFSSVNPGAMHGCAHDAHTAIGMGLAKIISEKRDKLSGKIKLIFQPAEEGGRGACSMVDKGVVDDVDIFLGLHIGLTLQETGALGCQAAGFLYSTKADVVYLGVPAHAGAAPEDGKNALLAAGTAMLNLHAINRHSKGASRVNVGVLNGGTGRNVIPATALIKFETRGITSEINEFMFDKAKRIIEGAAIMHDVSYNLELMGKTTGCESDPGLVSRIRQAAERSGAFQSIHDTINFGGGEDATFFMKHVQERGGQAAYFIIGSKIASGHHDSRFDIEDDSMIKGTTLLAELCDNLLS